MAKRFLYAPFFTPLFMFLSSCSPSQNLFLDTSGSETSASRVSPMPQEQILSQYFPNRNLTWMQWGGVNVRTGEFRPAGDEAPKADILFLHGFGDNMLNHGPLFKNWTDSGFRVVSFDFPSHGESIGDSINDFDSASGPILGLAKLAFAVEQKYRKDSSRPFLIAGWSTGGLLAIRMAQGLGSYNGHRDIDALILLAPGVFVRPIVGENGTVTLKTLTQDAFAPHIGKITPNRPAFEVTFAVDLLVNGRIASQHEFPNVPTLVVLGDEELDRYIFSKKTKTWVSTLKANGSSISAFECPGAMHELDNEGNGIGVEVRREVLKFSRKIVNLSSVSEPVSICRSL